MGRAFVGIARAELHFGEIGSLKGKRMYLRKMRDHLTRRYGVSFAEAGYQDRWQRASVVVASAASDAGVLERTLDGVASYLDAGEWELVSWSERVVEVDER